MIEGVFRYHLMIRTGLIGPLWSSDSGSTISPAVQEAV